MNNYKNAHSLVKDLIKQKREREGEKALYLFFLISIQYFKFLKINHL